MAGTESPSLELADATRRGEQTATAYELWQQANEEARSDSERRDLYRHAMLHAGLAVTRAGTPYQRCPVCRERLLGR